MSDLAFLAGRGGAKAEPPEPPSLPTGLALMWAIASCTPLPPTHMLKIKSQQSHDKLHQPLVCACALCAVQSRM